MRRAARVDANQSEIVKAFRSLGCSVHCTNDVWDLTVAFGGINILIEVKDGKKRPSAQKLTELAKDFHASWLGRIYLVRNIDDAVECVAYMRRLARLNA